MAGILGALDDKIELNRCINDNLEEQAKALFNHYFIQNTENLGEWQDGVLTDIAQYLNGLAMQKYPAMPNEAGLPVLKIKELGQGQCDTNSDRCSSLIKPEYIISDGTIIFSWSGTLLVDIWCGGKCGLNQHLFKVSSAKYPQWFVFYWTKHHLNKFIRIAKDKAVTMGHIKRCDLEISKVKIPSKQALVNLDKLFSPIFNRMVTCRIENRKLSSLRDTLLPKLMSGEISVEEVSLD
ncbi:restriction endonuclease subunit S [Alistipes onderdonkii]|nr:restriction endonuclease subunit S [Alistipes onderdonkii]KAA2521225.1 restriction endonuclease subunit S [Alistipes onderdonkii]KAA2561447.1 restriction endonuclease subunit S [Alistipes onderdonkii]KAA2594545.1 restriction endonuclease subunit S [Alistipes onderdonkii]KAA2629353.1 restriction endonuclease subunit S [Alistipes onderdonkii]